MKKIYFILLFSFIGCTHLANNKNEEVSQNDLLKLSQKRAIASEDYNSFTALQLFEELRGTVSKLKIAFPEYGNPRYYLFQNFLKTFDSVGQSIDLKSKSNQQIFNQKQFVPSSKEVVFEFQKLVLSYYAMSKAGIYLNYMTDFTGNDSEEVAELLTTLDHLMSGYEAEVSNYFGFESIITQNEKMFPAHISYVKFLAKKVLSRLDRFEFEQTDERKIKSVLKELSREDKFFGKLSNRKIAKIYASTNYQLMQKKLKDLPLPDSGEIEGADDAYESVMSVQFGTLLINFIIEQSILGDNNEE